MGEVFKGLELPFLRALLGLSAAQPTDQAVRRGRAFQLSHCFLQGYMLKKGHKRKNWTERWFVLKPNIISYYVSEDLKDKKGDIILDGNCCVEVKKK